MKALGALAVFVAGMLAGVAVAADQARRAGCPAARRCPLRGPGAAAPQEPAPQEEP